MPTIVDILETSFASLWVSVLEFLPRLIGAIVVFLIGLLIAAVLRKVVIKVVEFLRLDELAKKLEITSSFQKAGLRFNIGIILGWVVKWFFIIVFLIASTDILGWEQVTDFLQEVVLFLPNVIIAAVMLIAGILLANFVRNVVRTSMKAARLESADFVAGVAKWAILVFAFMAAMVQLNIAPGLISTLFTGLIAMFAIGGGLAFGLGGKENATRFLDRLRRDISG